MPTAAGYAQCSYRLKHSALPRNAYITFGVHPTLTDPVAIATAIAVAYTPIQTFMDSNVTMTEVRVSYGIDGSADLVGIAPAVLVGSRSGNSSPPNVATLLHKQSARGGRRGRGRMFIPWWSSTIDYDEVGAFNSTYLTNANTAAASWLTAMSTGGVPVVLLHRNSKPGIPHPTPPGAPNTVTSMTCDGLVATQRRRLGR